MFWPKESINNYFYYGKISPQNFGLRFVVGRTTMVDKCRYSVTMIWFHLSNRQSAVTE